MHSPRFIGTAAVAYKLNFYLEFDVIAREVTIYAERYYEPRVPKVSSSEPRDESRVSSRLPSSRNVCFSIAEMSGLATQESASHKVQVMMSRIFLN